MPNHDFQQSLYPQDLTDLVMDRMKMESELVRAATKHLSATEDQFKRVLAGRQTTKDINRIGLEKITMYLQDLALVTKGELVFGVKNKNGEFVDLTQFFNFD